MADTGLIIELGHGVISVNAFDNVERTTATHVFADTDEATKHVAEVLMAIRAVKDQQKAVERAQRTGLYR